MHISSYTNNLQFKGRAKKEANHIYTCTCSGCIRSSRCSERSCAFLPFNRVCRSMRRSSLRHKHAHGFSLAEQGVICAGLAIWQSVKRHGIDAQSKTLVNQATPHLKKGVRHQSETQADSALHQLRGFSTDVASINYRKNNKSFLLYYTTASSTPRLIEQSNKSNASWDEHTERKKGPWGGRGDSRPWLLETLLFEPDKRIARNLSSSCSSNP